MATGASGSWRPQMTTDAPAASSERVMASPTPRVPPVTTATRSVKSNDALSDWAIDTITSPRSEPRSAEAYRGVLAPS